MKIDCPTKQYVEANQVASIQYVNEQISKKQKQNNMNKPKFKSVIFKPLKLTLQYNDDKNLWGTKYIFPEVYFGTEVQFTEQYILENSELFEVEKAEREFEDGAWYKLYSNKYKHGYTLGYYYELLNCFYIVGTNAPHYQKDFDRIGERIYL